MRKKTTVNLRTLETSNNKQTKRRKHKNILQLLLLLFFSRILQNVIRVLFCFCCPVNSCCPLAETVRNIFYMYPEWSVWIYSNMLCIIRLLCATWRVHKTVSSLCTNTYKSTVDCGTRIRRHREQRLEAKYTKLNWEPFLISLILLMLLLLWLLLLLFCCTTAPS